MSFRSNKSHRTLIAVLALLLIGMCWGICPVQATADSFNSSFVDLETRSTCQIHLDHKHSDKHIDQEIETFQSLAEEALTLRAITIKVGKDLQKKAEADIPLTGEDMDLLSFGLVTHLDLRHDLMTIAEAHECWLLMDDDDLHEVGISKDGYLDGIMVSLAAALVLYDNYMMTATLFEGDPKLRQILNEGDQGYQINKAELLKVSLSYHSAIKRARVRRAMKYYEKAIASGKYSHVNSYLATLIDQSPSYDMVREWSPLHVLNSKLGLYSNITADSFTILQKEGVSMFSMLFGNSVGLIETRKGKLYDRKDVYAEMEKTLQSGDILLEKTPFRLTDKLIPGYWGHAAVWIGTEEELKRLGIWDDPIVKQHHEAIKNGNLIVEALRSGVEMNRLTRFLNIDSIGVLRKLGLTDDDRRTIVLQSLRQVGKSYDFNFDVESLEKVYCSKLIYLAYHGIDWSVKESFGRTTFTPDDIASNIFVDDALNLVSFYHDGKKVEKAPVKTLASLMEVASQ
jgi:hypothetical protein